MRDRFVPFIYLMLTVYLVAVWAMLARVVLEVVR